MSRNIFLQKDIPQEIQHIFDTTHTPDKKQVTITENDAIYFSIQWFNKSESESNKNNLDTNPFLGGDEKFDWTPITDAHFFKFDSTSSNDIRTELEFMESLNLAVYKDPDYFIHPFAKILYDPKKGLFKNYEQFKNNKMNKNEYLKVHRPFLILLHQFILPGWYWMYYYNKQRLPEIIAERTLPDQYMIDIRMEWHDIDDMLNATIEADASPAGSTGSASSAGSTGSGSGDSDDSDSTGSDSGESDSGSGSVGSDSGDSGD